MFEFKLCNSGKRFERYVRQHAIEYGFKVYSFTNVKEGIPDFHMSYNGYVFWLECKSYRFSPTVEAVANKWKKLQPTQYSKQMELNKVTPVYVLIQTKDNTYLRRICEL